MRQNEIERLWPDCLYLPSYAVGVGRLGVRSRQGLQPPVRGKQRESLFRQMSGTFHSRGASCTAREARLRN